LFGVFKQIPFTLKKETEEFKFLFGRQYFTVHTKILWKKHTTSFTKTPDYKQITIER